MKKDNDMPDMYSLKGGIYLPISGLTKVEGYFLILTKNLESILEYEKGQKILGKILGILVNEEQYCIPHEDKPRDILMFYLLNKEGNTNTTLELSKTADIPYSRGYNFSGLYRGRQIISPDFSKGTPNPDYLIDRIRYMGMDVKEDIAQDVSFILAKR